MTVADRERLIGRIGDDPALWRAEAWASYAQVSDELERIEGRGGAAPHEVAIVRGNLDEALRAMAPQQPGERESGWGGMRAAFARLWAALKLYYSGSAIERTWAAIHRASAALYRLFNCGELSAQAMRLRELVAELPDLKAQLASVTDALAKLKPDAGDTELGYLRAVLQELYEEATGATDSLQTQARVLRNTLLVASGALFLIVFALGVVHLFDTSIVPLCTTAGDGGTVCPDGDGAHPFDVFAIELAGMLGGIISVVVPLATGERIKTPYRVFNHQLLLKVLAGAAAGLAGVVLVESGFISAFTVSSGAAIVGYAIFFGAAQQALTGVVDRRANELGEETPTAKSV